MDDREATCDWNCILPFPHVGPCSPSQKCCGDPAPNRSTRSCDLPQGHDGDHWTYAGRTLKWPQASEEDAWIRIATDNAKDANARYEALKSQRDELLAALKGVVLVGDRNTTEFDAARAAIRKAEKP